MAAVSPQEEPKEVMFDSYWDLQIDARWKKVECSVQRFRWTIKAGRDDYEPISNSKKRRSPEEEPDLQDRKRVKAGVEVDNVWLINLVLESAEHKALVKATEAFSTQQTTTQHDSKQCDGSIGGAAPEKQPTIVDHAAEISQAVETEQSPAEPSPKADLTTSEVTSLQQRLAEMEKQLSKATSRVTEAEEVLTKERSSATKGAADVEKRHREEMAEASRLKEEAMAQASQSGAELTATKQQLAETASRVDEVNQNLATELSSVHEKLAKVEKQLGEVREEANGAVSQATSRAREAEQRFTTLRSEWDAEKAEMVKQFKEAMDQASQRNNELTETLSAGQTQLTALENQLVQERQSASDESSRKDEEVTNELKGLQQQAAAMEAQRKQEHAVLESGRAEEVAATIQSLEGQKVHIENSLRTHFEQQLLGIQQQNVGDGRAQYEYRLASEKQRLEIGFESEHEQRIALEKQHQNLQASVQELEQRHQQELAKMRENFCPAPQVHAAFSQHQTPSRMQMPPPPLPQFSSPTSSPWTPIMDSIEAEVPREAQMQQDEGGETEGISRTTNAIEASDSFWADPHVPEWDPNANEDDKIEYEFRSHASELLKKHSTEKWTRAYDRLPKVLRYRQLDPIHVHPDMEMRAFRAILKNEDAATWAFMYDYYNAVVACEDLTEWDPPELGMLYWNTDPTKNVQAVYFADRGSTSAIIPVYLSNGCFGQNNNTPTCPLPPLPSSAFEDRFEKEIYAQECVLAQLPECQLDAATAFLNREEHAAFRERMWGEDGEENSPRLYNCTEKELFPTMWEKVVRLLRGMDHFRCAAKAYAAGDGRRTAGKDKYQSCWPAWFSDRAQDMFQCGSLEAADELREQDYQPVEDQDQDAMNGLRRVQVRTDAEVMDDLMTAFSVSEQDNPYHGESSMHADFLRCAEQGNASRPAASTHTKPATNATSSESDTNRLEGTARARPTANAASRRRRGRPVIDDDDDDEEPNTINDSGYGSDLAGNESMEIEVKSEPHHQGSDEEL